MGTPRSKLSLLRLRCGPRGFTLIEILIVVVILGIIGAIVVPQFSNASHVARENTLKDDLRYLRTQIIVYKAEHKDLPPGYQNGALASAPGAVFLSQMTQYTDVSGNTSPTASAVFMFGPYLQRMPPNPLTTDESIKIVSSSPPVPDDTTGWLYNPATQEILANSTMKDADGTPYAQY